MAKGVLTTGGSSGMGRGATRLFPERRWRVVVTDRNQENGETLIAELTDQRFHGVFFCRGDVSENSDVKAPYDYTLEATGGIDVHTGQSVQ